MDKQFGFAVDSARGVIDIRYKSDIAYVTWVQVSALMTSLDAGSALRNARFTVAGFTAATRVNFSSDDASKKAEDLATKITSFNANLVVISITPQSLAYDLMRMLQSHIGEDRSPWESCLARSRDECKHLLQSLS